MAEELPILCFGLLCVLHTRRVVENVQVARELKIVVSTLHLFYFML